MIVPGVVSSESDVSDAPSGGAAVAFARPKSSSFVPADVSMTFCGLRSRWTMAA